MLREKIATVLKIHPEEMRMVTLLSALFLVVQAGQGFGDTASFALFVAHNVERMPYMYAPLGLAVFIVSLAYTASLVRFQKVHVVLWFLAGFVFLLLGEWLAIVLFQTSLTQYFWLTIRVMNVIISTLLWTTAGEVCDARQAKRLFPLFASTGIVGIILGNIFTGTLAKILGTNNLIALCAILLSGGFLILREITRVYFNPEPPLSVEFNFINDLRSGSDFVRTSGLFRLVAITAILYSVLFYTADFSFSQFVSKTFAGNEVGVANFKGAFSSTALLVTFLVTLFLANRLYTKLGIVNSILILPSAYLVGLAISVVFYRFEGILPLRFMQQVMLGGFISTAWNAMFNVVPIERRSQVLTFINGVPAQFGVALAGLVLIVGSSIFTSTRPILAFGLLLALICFYLTWKMRAEYGNALVSALQAGRVEVFSNEDEAFEGYEKDPAALQAIFKALRDPKPFSRRLAADMLAKMNNPSAIPDLVERLSDEDASVRAAATHALTELGAKSEFREIVLGLDDLDDSVREMTLASFLKLEIASSPELIRTLEHLLKDSNVRIRARAAVVLIYLGEPRLANSFLSRLIQSKIPDKRAIAVDAFREIASNAKNGLPFKFDLVLRAMSDPNPIVRRGAVRVAVYLKDDAVYKMVASHLADNDAGVRRAASESLKQVWPASRGVVLQALTEMDGVAVSSVLKSIPVGDVEILDALRSYIQREVISIRYLRMLVEPLPTEGRATKLLISTLKQRISLNEEQLVDAVGLFGNPSAMDLVRKSLNIGDTSTRAAALEALETLGDKRITTEVLPILDRGGMFHSGDDQQMTTAEVVQELLSSEEPWLRALAVYVLPELQLKNFLPEVRKLTRDTNLLVKEAAQNVLATMNGKVAVKKIVNSKTLKTLSTLDRILLLREVPMFSGLSPADLEQIAEIASEQLYSNQSLLCREGEPGNTLFIIASGKVDVIKLLGKTEQVLATNGIGGFVGEMAILESAPRSATLRANGDARVLVIDGDAFKAILLDRPEVAISVLRNMSMRVRELNAKIGAAS